MSKIHWKERYAQGGVCDFKANYDFFFKWLLNKVASCFYLKNLPETIDEWYTKTNLLLDGNICITDKLHGKLYSFIGALGGMPDEYYVPTIFTVANPILGSEQIKIGEDGVVIYNTATDKFYGQTFCSGLFELINQTATLLADNIISINASQINSRVQAIVTADSDPQAVAAEVILKKLYAGRPYQVLRSDMVDKIQVNPMSTASVSSNITELVNLHNYIIGNFFQSIGIKTNNIRKNAHVLQEEIDAQDQYLQLSVLEILTSWQKGFDEVNKMYGTDIQVELNPVMLDEIVDMANSNTPTEDSGMNSLVGGEFGEGMNEVDSADASNNTSDESVNDSDRDHHSLNNPQRSEVSEESEDDDVEVVKTTPVQEETNEVIEDIKEATETVEKIVDIINDSAKEEGGEDEDESDKAEPDESKELE